MKRTSISRPVIQAGMTINRLKAIRRLACHDGELWEFQCSCDGRIVQFPVVSVLRTRGARGSCGCLARENAVRQGKARTVPIPEAFLRHIDLENLPVPEMCQGFGPCLIWTGCGDGNNRPQMTVNRKSKRASHVAWFLLYAEWPDKGMHLLHVCHNLRCVNPYHLVPGDAKTNRQHRVLKERGAILSALGDPQQSYRHHEKKLHAFLRSVQTHRETAKAA